MFPSLSLQPGSLFSILKKKLKDHRYTHLGKD